MKNLQKEAPDYLSFLRQNGLAAELSMQNNIGKALKYANKIGSQFALIIAEEEYNQGKIIMKNLETGAQELVDSNDNSNILSLFMHGSPRIVIA